MNVRWLVAVLAILPTLGTVIAGEGKRIVDQSRDGGSGAAKKLVAQALEAEAAGDATKRAELLSEAVAADPELALARWHRGEVFVDGQWKSVRAAEAAAAMDPARMEYATIRKTIDNSVDSQVALARWCDEHKLTDEAKYHWSNVLSIEPYNADALRALDARWHNGRLTTAEDFKSAGEQAKKMRRAAKEAKPTLARWQRKFAAGDVQSRNEALDEIRECSDRVALVALEDITLDQELNSNGKFERSMEFGLALVTALEQCPDQAATDALLRHAAVAPVKSVRTAAADALKRRSPHGYVPQLLSLMSMPFESSFRVTHDNDGSVHYWHSLYREGRDANLSIEARNSLIQQDLNGATVIEGPDGEWGRSKESDTTIAVRIKRKAAALQAKFSVAAKATEAHVARFNSEIESNNERVATVLCNVTDQQLGADPKAWWNWWDDYNEYSTDGENPTYERRYVNTELEYHRMPAYAQMRHSCFAAGTLVWTKTGPQEIEMLEIGDFVLTQDTETGELAYKTVLGRTVRPSRPTLTIRCGDETIQATLGHPMWVAGQGWKMAKELRPGDALHGVQGPVLVESAAAAETIDVYNLVVDGAHNYFVGEAGILVHDNSPRRPTTTVVPGLSAK